MFDEKLGCALNFTADDLNFNRRGMMTEQQKRGIRIYGFLSTVLLPFVVIGFLALAYMWFVYLRESQELLRRFWGLFGSVGLCLVLFASVNIALLVLSFEFKAGRVGMVEGQVALSKRYKRRAFPHLVYRLEIDALEFGIDERTASLITIGDQYRIYYTPYTKRILSIERLKE